MNARLLIIILALLTSLSLSSLYAVLYLDARSEASNLIVCLDKNIHSDGTTYIKIYNPTKYEYIIDNIEIKYLVDNEIVLREVYNLPTKIPAYSEKRVKATVYGSIAGLFAWAWAGTSQRIEGEMTVSAYMGPFKIGTYKISPRIVNCNVLESNTIPVDVIIYNTTTESNPISNPVLVPIQDTLTTTCLPAATNLPENSYSIKSIKIVASPQDSNLTAYILPVLTNIESGTAPTVLEYNITQYEGSFATIGNDSRTAVGYIGIIKIINNTYVESVREAAIKPELNLTYQYVLCSCCGG